MDRLNSWHTLVDNYQRIDAVVKPTTTSVDPQKRSPNTNHYYMNQSLLHYNRKLQQDNSPPTIKTTPISSISSISSTSASSTAVKSTAIDPKQKQLNLRFFNQIAAHKQDDVSAVRAAAGLIILPSSTVEDVPHRRPGFRYFDPNAPKIIKKRILIYEDTIYLTQPSLHASTRSGYMDKNTALDLDRLNVSTSRRLRRVSMSAVPLPRVANLFSKHSTTFDITKKQTKEKQKQNLTHKEKPWVHLF